MALASLLAIGMASVRNSSGMSCNLAPWYLGMIRAWPSAVGWMSKNAYEYLVSINLKDGISPVKEPTDC